MGTKLSEVTPVVDLAAGDGMPILRAGGSNALGKVPAGGFAKLQGAQSFSGAQRSSSTVLTSASSSTAIDLSLNNDFTTTLSENTTFANPTNMVAGQKGRITITQGATVRTVAYGSYFKFPGGTVPAVTATAGATDVLFYDVISATKIVANLVKGFA